MNDERDINTDFAFLSENPVMNIEIVDRYLFAGSHNVQFLKELLNMFSQMWSWNNSMDKKRIKLSYGPAGSSEDESVWRNSAFELVVELQKLDQFKGITFEPHARSYREPKGDKHDRRIIVRSKPNEEETATSNPDNRRRRSGNTNELRPQAKTFTAELTGGVSHLMDTSSETTIFTWVK